ncbi:MAG: glycosyl hydrolase family 98, partial [Dysgonamonadaceae bacterium]|nr:glycosyl hydrolase family 98 [Dysgonamonadaceae bacterium]
GSGTNLNKYGTEPSLFTGLYAVDGEHSDNHIWTKSSGRYPTIPSIFQQGNYETGGFTKVVKKSNYAATWSSVAAKTAELNTMFPQEYTGNIYAGRI